MQRNAAASPAWLSSRRMWRVKSDPGIDGHIHGANHENGHRDSHPTGDGTQDDHETDGMYRVGIDIEPALTVQAAKARTRPTALGEAETASMKTTPSQTV